MLFDLSAIISTSLRTESAFWLMIVAECPTSCMVAESSSVTADRSEALSFEVLTLSCTSLTTSSSFLEFSIIIFMMLCSFAIKVLIPFPRSEISSFDKILIRLVRSPSLWSMPLIMSLISWFATISFLIIKINTLYNVIKRAITLSTTIMVFFNTALLYSVVNASLACMALACARAIILST